MTISDLRTRFLDGSYTPTQALHDSLSVIKKSDGDIHAYLGLFAGAKDEAVTAEKIIKELGEQAPALAGIPVALKSNIMIAGEKVTAASKILENYTATYDATVVKRLKAAGAVMVGNTNMDEFAMGSSTENSAFGPTKNPLDLTRVPGGSSGGSAAAVAMDSVPVAIGTDTGGSIRQPASFCGLVGFKPTYGAVSRYGLIAMGSSLDQAGPLTKTVADAELVHSIIAGKDVNDMTSLSEDTYQPVPNKDRYRIGVPRDFLRAGIDEDVRKVFDDHLEALVAAGHEIVDVELPLFSSGLASYYISMPAEVSSNLARYDGIRYGNRAEGSSLLEVYEKSRAQGFGPEVKRRILLGTYVLSAGYYDAYYGKSEAVRVLMREELAKLYESVDLIITPTSPTPAFVFGEHKDPMAIYAQDVFTVPANLTGVPALSIPAGSVKRDGIELPVGVQYIAPHAGDARLFDIGKRMNAAG